MSGTNVINSNAPCNMFAGGDATGTYTQDAVEISIIKEEILSDDGFPAGLQSFEIDGSVLNFPCPECKRVYETKELMEQHYTLEHTEAETFSCPKCAVVFNSKQMLNFHISRNHSSKQLKCKECDKNFQDKVHLQKHFNNFHRNKNKIKCSECEMTFSVLASFREHKKDEHPKDKAKPVFFCNECTETFSDKSSLNNHIEQHESEQNFTCDQVYEDETTFPAQNCQMTIGDSKIEDIDLDHIEFYKNTTNHSFKKKLDDRIPVCKGENDENVDFIINSQMEGDLLYTRKMKCAENPIACPDCDLKFKKHVYMKQHWQREHTEKSAEWLCEICSQTFKSKSYLAGHVRRNHTGQVKPSETPAQCPECFKIYKSQKRLQTHYRGIHGKAQFMCFLCEKTFCDVSAYRRHNHLYHNKSAKTHDCPHCDKNYKVFGVLKQHIRLKHTVICTLCGLKFLVDKIDEHKCPLQDNNTNAVEDGTAEVGLGMKEHVIPFKPVVNLKLPCPTCGALFKRVSYLKQHIARQHTAEPDTFLCHLCSYTFNNKSYLASHIRRQHSSAAGETFPCPICTKCFSKEYLVKIHVRNIHMVKQRLSCEFCSKTYKARNNLRRHHRKVHNYFPEVSSRGRKIHP